MLILDGHGADRLADRDRELAAGQEAGGLARKGGQRRLRERGHEPVVLHQVERPEQVGPENMTEQPERGAPDEVVEGRAGDGFPHKTGDWICRSLGHVDGSRGALADPEQMVRAAVAVE